MYDIYDISFVPVTHGIRVPLIPGASKTDVAPRSQAIISHIHISQRLIEGAMTYTSYMSYKNMYDIYGTYGIFVR